MTEEMGIFTVRELDPRNVEFHVTGGEYVSYRILDSLGVNQMAYVGQDPSTVEIDGMRLLHVGDGKYQVIRDTEYIETLEHAVLVSWRDQTPAGWHCRACQKRIMDHTADCIVPALLAKYEESPQ